MGNLKRNANRFLYRHRDKGIPNLMLYLSIGNVIVNLLALFLESKGINLGSLLMFNAERILAGQVWRLFTFPLIYLMEIRYLIFKLLSLYVCYWVGKAIEGIWGTLRLNLFYLSAVLLMDLVGILLYVIFSTSAYFSAIYINSSLFLAIATLCPEQTVLVFFFIPLKMRWAALVNVAWTVYEILDYALPFAAYSGSFFWYVLLFASVAPLVALINYLLFFGRNVKNLFVPPKIYQTIKKKQKKTTSAPNPDWAKNYRGPAGERPYRHKCTVCGRTDADCPGLEFRYCSKCAGYFCYCIDHINNHTHVQ